MVHLAGRVVQTLLDYVNYVNICSKLQCILEKQEEWPDICDILSTTLLLTIHVIPNLYESQTKNISLCLFGIRKPTYSETPGQVGYQETNDTETTEWPRVHEHRSFPTCTEELPALQRIWCLWSNGWTVDICIYMYFIPIYLYEWNYSICNHVILW